MEYGNTEQLFSQPRDLRQISAAMKMITDMERIGDHCTNIAECVEFSVTGIHKDSGKM